LRSAKNRGQKGAAPLGEERTLPPAEVVAFAETNNHNFIVKPPINGSLSETPVSSNFLTGYLVFSG